MPINTYEAMFVLDSAKAAANWDESVQSVHGILGKHNAEIVATRHWDDRRLAYAIGTHRKGSFLLTYFKAEGNAIKEIESDCKLNELIVRNMILKIHPKLVDHLVAQAMSSTPSENEERAAAEDDYDDRPRRRRRDD